MMRLSAVVIGAGVLGLWQAFELARRGHQVIVREAMEEAQSGASSRNAGAMLAPFCEAETATPVIQKLGLRSLELWRRSYSGVTSRGSLVVSTARDRGELLHFARRTTGHRVVNAGDIEFMEPDLAGRFTKGLFYSQEAHLVPRPALDFLIGELRALGVEIRFGEAVAAPIWLAGAAGDVVIDCRGISAREDLVRLRGVRGEMAVLSAPSVKISRPIRLMHPRFPLYVVPWGEGKFMLGATALESEDTGAVTLRSGLDLLSSGCVVSPAFAEAEIVELCSCIRPAYPDNVPRIALRGRCIFVNGAYRHGFLTAPALAELVADYLETGATYTGIFEDQPED